MAYVGLGVGYGRATGANEVHPHVEFWLQIPGLIGDGVRYSKWRVRPEPHPPFAAPQHTPHITYHRSHITPPNQEHALSRADFMSYLMLWCYLQVDTARGKNSDFEPSVRYRPKSSPDPLLADLHSSHSPPAAKKSKKAKEEKHAKRSSSSSSKGTYRPHAVCRPARQACSAYRYLPR